VKLIRIQDGELALSTAGEHTRPLVLRNVDIEVKDFAAASEFPFSLQAKVAGGGSVALDGKAGPINPSDTAASPASLALKIDGLDLVGSGLAQHAPTLAGLITIDGSGSTDGKTAHIQGKLKAEKLKLAKEGTPAKKPVAFEFAVDHDLRRRSGRLQKGDIHIGGAPAHLTGTYATHGETASLNMTLDGPKMPVDELTELLPAMAVVLPRGSSLKGGTASAKISIEGPMDKLVTDGTVSLDNTKLTGFDMGRKMAFVETLAGIKASNDTEIQTLGAALHYSPEGGRVQNLQFIVPSIGNLQGDGTVSPSNDLAFDMRATIRSIAVPFKIQGPATDPSFRPDVKGIAKEQIKSVVGSESVKGLLKGILGKK
jgi:AsmA protein